MARTSFVDVALRLRGARRFNAEVAAATKQLEAMGVKGAASMGAFAQKADRFRQAGRSLTMGLTLPIVAGGAAAVKMSMDYNSSFGQIERLVGINRQQLEAWKGDILDISDQTGIAAKSLADAMFFITSAGLRGQTAVAALNASARASAAGLGETKTIADAVTSAMNAYGPSVLSASQATDVLLATVREGKMEAGDLAPVIGKVIPIADAMGVSFDQAAGAMAVMSRSGTNAATAATQTSSILSTFAKPTTQMTDALSAMGLSLDGVRNQLKNRGLVPTLASLRDGAAKAGIDLSQVFGNKRALTGVLQLTKNLNGTEKIMRGVANSTGATDEAFGKLQNSRGFKLNKAMNQLKNALIRLGDEIGPIIVPKITQFLEALGKVATWLNGMPKGVKIAIGIFVGLLAILGPALMLLGAIATGVGVAMMIATSPITLIVLGVMAFIAVLVLAYTKLDWFRNAVNTVFNVWRTVVVGAIKGVIAAFGWVKTAVTNAGNWIKNAWNNVVAFVKGLPARIRAAASGMWNGIKEGFRSAVNFIIRGWNSIELSFNIPDEIPGLPGTLTISTPNIPELATGGTVTSAGTALVGERGPELLSLPRGASVIPLSDRMAAVGGNQRIEVPVYLNGRQIALAVADQVSSERARS